MLPLPIVKEVSAQWSILFEHDGPTCLRLRPIISPDHPLRELCKPERRDLLQQECSEIDRLLNGKPPFIRKEIPDFEPSALARPRLTAFVVAARLVANGFHERYVARTRILRFLANEDGRWSYDPDQLSISEHFSEDRARFEPRMPRITEHQCIFAGSTPVLLTAKRASELGIRKYDLEELPAAAADRLLELAARYGSVERWLNTGHYVCVGVNAGDPNTAIELATRKIEELRCEAPLGIVCSLKPRENLDPQVVILVDGTVITFDWKSYDRSAVRLSRRTDAQVIRQALGRNDALSKLIQQFSEAKSALDIASDKEIFLKLAQLQDVFFGDYVYAIKRLNKANKFSKSDYFIDLAARWMAMNAPREIMASALNEEWSKGRSVVDRHKARPAPLLYDGVSTELPVEQPYHNGEPRYSRERILIRMDYIKRMEAGRGQWQRYFRKHYTRSALDFYHIRAIRNKLVHEADYAGGSYYITLMLELLRGILGYRVACEAAYGKLDEAGMATVRSLAARTGLTEYAIMFVIAIHGLVIDSMWSLGEPARFWISEQRIPKMHTYGWGGWTGAGFESVLASRPNLAAEMGTFCLEPLAALGDLADIEIL